MEEMKGKQNISMALGEHNSDHKEEESQLLHKLSPMLKLKLHYLLACHG